MQNIIKFKDLVESNHFIEAHEVLEDDWLKFKKAGELDKAKLYKGLINGATSIALYKMNRSKRAVDITWGAFIKYKSLSSFIEEDKKRYVLEAISLIESKQKEIINRTF
ncbi:MAG: DUF309 domain-containing protein [Campylobacterota bacterium]|nr:DUF309 domain-containing protein [Campylobacterota bacterium]